MNGDYFQLFIAAEISDARDQERYARYLDAAVAQQGLEVDEIVGVGEQGTGSKPELYIVGRQTIVKAFEIGLLNKRLVVEPVAPIASISRLRGTQEGYKGLDVALIATDSNGKTLFKLVWGVGGPDWVEGLVMRQRDHLFALIGKAMDDVSESPLRPSVSDASSKAGALTDWAADVVRAAGVEMTQERVEEHANMVAATIGFYEFLPIGAQLGMDGLSKFFPGGAMPPGTPLETFDDLYERVVAHVGDARAVDQMIDKYLSDHWAEFVNGCRESYS